MVCSLFVPDEIADEFEWQMNRPDMSENLLRLVAAFSVLVRAASEACTEADMIRERLDPCHGDEVENLAYVVKVLEDGLDDALDMVTCGAEKGSTAERA